MLLPGYTLFWARNFGLPQGRRSKRTRGVFENTLRTFLTENAAAGQKDRPKPNSCEISGLGIHSPICPPETLSHAPSVKKSNTPAAFTPRKIQPPMQGLFQLPIPIPPILFPLASTVPATSTAALQTPGIAADDTPSTRLSRRIPGAFETTIRSRRCPEPRENREPRA
jgi:hypothetical protein